MQQDARKIVIVGGGIAGLCAAVYARKCGYQAEVLEMHDVAGGLAANWRRCGYTFETCLHWLYGSNPASPMHAVWREVCDIDRLTFVDHELFGCVQAPTGDALPIFTDVDRLEAEFLRRAPQDAKAVRQFTAAIRKFAKFQMPSPGRSWFANLSTLLSDLPCLPLLRRLSRVSCIEYGQQFTDPLLRSVFGEGEMGGMTALALFFSLGWMCQRDASYAVGGSQALIRLIVERLASLGARLRLGETVERILVENDTATGVRLANGEIVPADWVISAADAHATHYDLLGGKYLTESTRKPFEQMQTFPSYLQISLGVARDLAGQPPIVTRLLDAPLSVDPGTQLHQASFRIFNFDRTFAPSGKTAVTCFLPTRNFEYWSTLERSDHHAYQIEKHRVAVDVIAILDTIVPGISSAVEVVDVSTPATVFRYTGNWRGSMEGWFIPPGVSFRPMPKSLPGLRRFLMVGQWVTPGGGLPSGPMSARPAIQSICRHDRVPFTPAA